MKEELIKELVANSKLTNRINLQYQQKLDILQKENMQLKAEIEELQRSGLTTGNPTSAAAATTSREPSRVET